jgi:hypothetical protein
VADCRGGKACSNGTNELPLPVGEKAVDKSHGFFRWQIQKSFHIGIPGKSFFSIRLIEASLLVGIFKVFISLFCYRSAAFS